MRYCTVMKRSLDEQLFCKTAINKTWVWVWPGRFAACQLATAKGITNGESSKKQGAVIELSGASCLLKSWMPGTCCSVSKKCLLQGCCCCEWRECPGAGLECEAHDTCIPHLKQAATLPFLCGLCGCRTFNVAADSSIIEVLDGCDGPDGFTCAWALYVHHSWRWMPLNGYVVHTRGLLRALSEN
jgi:hypothetical protein